MKARAIVLLTGVVLLAGAVAVAAWNPFGWAAVDRLVGGVVGGPTAAADAGVIHTCPMHPQVLQEGPGTCPLCKMDLVPVETDEPPQQEEDSHEHDLHTCPMHPQVLQEGPGTCPLCKMDLVPVETDEPDTGAGSGSGSDSRDGPGVHVSAGFLQRFGVRTTTVERGALPVEIRTVGALAHNERHIYSVNTKFAGWIERARVNNVGEQVQADDVLFEIYSPELVATQQEYLTAMDYVDQLRARGAYAGAIERAEGLLEAARERLLYWDMTARQIDELATTREAMRTIEFVSPASGFIVEKMSDSLEGMRLTPGMTVLKIADHSTLWVQADFYEPDVRHLREGQRVSVTVDAFPERRWSGSILFFRPAMNPGTRTLTAFVEVANADLRLRPRMFANVTALAPGAADTLIVPADAVLHSGEQAVVVIARGDGYFTPREVHLGLASNGRQQVIDGLDGGEEIVISSQFLIDSESNLRAAIAQLLGERDGDD